jgi:hypothetical protein
MKNIDRLRWIVEELCDGAQKGRLWEKVEAYGKVLDEINDLEKKYKEIEG